MSGIYPIEDIRQDYHALSEVTYLNTGTIGIMSESVLSTHLENISAYERYGHSGEARARELYEQARSRMASLINVSPGELVLTRNASDGVNFVLAGLDWSTGTNLLTTSEEHPAVLLPMSSLVRRNGGEIHMLDVVADKQAMLSQLRSMLEKSSYSLAVISHVSCETGIRLPIKQICEMCRAYGVRTLVDGAQSVGQFDVDFAEIQCDFATGNGHKWLCGPKGTGFLYVKRDQIDALSPPYLGDGSIDPAFDRARFLKDAIAIDWKFRPDAQRFEFGTRNWHLYGALTDAIEQIESIGPHEIQRHVARISDFAKAELSQRDLVRVLTPTSWEQSCGLVAFSVEGWDGVELSNRLWEEYRVIQRRVQIPSAVRISCAHYTNENDVRTFLDALDSLIR
jgi:selenocysteine lyase/cysteine desulfurase